jgi:peptidyl-prolyl cis-trans isomerase B (cyclophilin B)
MAPARFALPVLALALALACGRGASDAKPGDAAHVPGALARIDAGPHDVAVLDLGDLGTVRIELLPELAPRTVESFEKLAEQGFYDGTTFHRVIPGFMIQGGDPNSRNKDPRDDGRGGPGYTLPDEFSDYPHVRGTVSMANTGSRDSAGSQFFIVQQDSRFLDGGYTAFGRVVQGIEAVDAVTHLPIDVYGRYGPRDRPYPTNAVIRSVRIEHARLAARSADAPANAAAAPPGSVTRLDPPRPPG